MSASVLCKEFLSFLAESPTPYHAAKNLAGILEKNGFHALEENQSWQLSTGEGYFYTRSDSTIVGFVLGKQNSANHGIRLVGAHTDSPCLKVKPVPEKNTKGYQQLGIEVYGGVLLNPWFDRDLSLAGKVCFSDASGALKSTLVDFKKPIAVIPSLAIHLDREANKNKTVNPQTEMNPILFQGSEDFELRHILKEEIERQEEEELSEVLDFDLSFYDVQHPSVVGLQEDFIAGARLDNLLSSFVAIHSLATCSREYSSIAVCNDHEEVGSRTDIGAQGTVLADLFGRLFPEEEQRQVALRSSLMMSVDNAHGIHPNYVAKHDDNHGPILNDGPVLKYDANQSYATSAHSASFVKSLAKHEPELPLQSFVTRADMRCGSTIGPLTAANIGIKTLDLGVPTFAMHSTRELAGRSDLETLSALISRFFEADNVAL